MLHTHVLIMMYEGIHLPIIIIQMKTEQLPKNKNKNKNKIKKKKELLLEEIH